MEQQLIRLLAGNITKLFYGTYISDQFGFPLVEFQFSRERIKKLLCWRLCRSIGGGLAA
jgi:hypothetical protein